MRPEWYFFDPIHIRPSLWQPVWRHLLTGDSVSMRQPLSRLEWFQVYRLRPERRRMFGVEQVTPQHGQPLPLGGRVWLY